MMEWLKISHYKSIEHLELDCKRINVFIGRPNVGKSNILEAVSLLNPLNTTDTYVFGKSTIRYEQFKDLFHFNNIKEPIIVSSSSGQCVINYLYSTDTFMYRVPANYSNIDIDALLASDDGKRIITIIEEFRKEYIDELLDSSPDKELLKQGIAPCIYTIKKDGHFSDETGETATYHNPIKKYDFTRYNSNNLGNNRFTYFLIPPNGSNLIAIMENNADLMKFCFEIFREYNLELLINKDANKDNLEIHRKEGYYTYKIPFSSVADTLQRIIFHQAAILSNRNSVLLFEEPEAHSFPPYIKTLAESIAKDEYNQYFITTHSPFILNTIIENTDLKDVNVFKTDYKNNKTEVTQLTDSELLDLLNYGQDIFFHI